MFSTVKILLVSIISLLVLTNSAASSDNVLNLSDKQNVEQNREQNTAKSFVYFHFNQDGDETNKYKSYKYSKSTKSPNLNYFYTNKYKPDENLQSLSFHTTTPNIYKENLIDEEHYSGPVLKKQHQIVGDYKKPFYAPYKSNFKPEEDSNKLDFYVTTPNYLKDFLEGYHKEYQSGGKYNLKPTDGYHQLDITLKPEVLTCKYPCSLNSLKRKPEEDIGALSLFTTTPNILKENLIDDQYLINNNYHHRHHQYKNPFKVESFTFRHPHSLKYKPEDGVHNNLYSTTPNFLKDDLIVDQYPINEIKTQNIYHNPNFNPHLYTYNPYKYPTNVENTNFKFPYTTKHLFEDELKLLSLKTTTTTTTTPPPRTTTTTPRNNFGKKDKTKNIFLHHRPNIFSHLEYKLPTYPKNHHSKDVTEEKKKEEEEDEDEDPDLSTEETPKKHNKKEDQHKKDRKNKNSSTKSQKNKKKHNSKTTKSSHSHSHNKDTQDRGNKHKSHKNKQHKSNASQNKSKGVHVVPYTKKIIVPIRGSSSRTKSKKGVLHPKHFNGEVDKQTVDLINAIIDTIQKNVDSSNSDSEENAQKHHKKIKVDWSMEEENNT